MDLNKARYFLRRIHTIIELHPDGLTSLDRDVVLEDIRRLYDTVLDVDSNLISPNKSSERNAHSQAEVQTSSVSRSPEPPAAPQPENKITEIVSNPISENTQQDTTSNKEKEEDSIPAPAASFENLPEKEIPAALPNGTSNTGLNSGVDHLQNEIVQSNESHSEIVVEEPRTLSNEYDYLFDFKIDSDLSAKLGNAKIENINSVLSINDKILYINQLFKGEAIPFQEALKKFQSFYTFEEAKSYAVSELVEEFNWNNPDKKDIVQSFMRQVHRLY